MKNKLVGLSLFSLVLISLISFTNASMPVYIITGYDDFTVTYGPNNLTTYNVSILAYRKGRIGFDTGITETFVLGNSKFYLYNRTILPVSLMVGPIENDSYTYTYAAPELVWETVTHVPNVTLVYNNSYQLQNKELIDFDELNTYNW